MTRYFKATTVAGTDFHTGRIDYAAAAQYGVSTPKVLSALQALVEGEKVTQIVEGSRRFALVVKLSESARSVEGLGQILIETPTGRIPLSKVASIEDGDGPNQISRDDGKRRIVLSANASGRALSEIVADIRKIVSDIQQRNRPKAERIPPTSEMVIRKGITGDDLGNKKHR